jgi:hypothetical protein
MLLTEQHSRRCALYTIVIALLVVGRVVTVSIDTCTCPEVSAMLQGTTEGNSMVGKHGTHYLKPGGSLRVDQGYGGKHNGPQQHCQAAELWRQSC